VAISSIHEQTLRQPALWHRRGSDQYIAVCDGVATLMNNMKIAFVISSIHNIICNDYATATIVLISEYAIAPCVLEIVKT